MKVVAFDVGKLHLAVRGEEILEKKVEPLIFELSSFETKIVDRTFLKRLSKFLDSFDFSTYDLIIIEGQMTYMGFGRGHSPTNTKIQHFLESYFVIQYPKIEVEIVQAKSKYPKELKGKTDQIRKGWASRQVRKLFEIRNDQASLEVLKEAEFFEKSDDLADTVLLIFSYFRKNPTANVRLEDIFSL